MGRCITTKMLSQYIDGELPAWAAGDVRKHLAMCEECSKAYDRMRGVEAAIHRHRGGGDGPAPDVAARVCENLGRHGAFLRARLEAGRRRLFGPRLMSVRMGAAVAVAASVMFMGAMGLDYLTRDDWARATAPVVSDAERVLVRLVYVDPSDPERVLVCDPEMAARLAKARDEARRLSIPERLAEARRGAAPAAAGDIDCLASTFARLAGGEGKSGAALNSDDLADALGRAVRLRERLGSRI